MNIDDDLYCELKERADREQISLSEMVNRVLRAELAFGDGAHTSLKRPIRQKTYNMGLPKFDVTKAIAFADELEAEEVIGQMRRAREQSVPDTGKENR